MYMPDPLSVMDDNKILIDIECVLCRTMCGGTQTLVGIGNKASLVIRIKVVEERCEDGSPFLHTQNSPMSLGGGSV